ncbi:unnamed protein product [Rhizoctonia solani]|uniref:Solute carrier family 40 member n=1 Tax=Rhizoctonia solani TaxID=456999 RepID=A0A8H3DEP4_9AGAM|nr:unnamed protein product [Rhizoctonia solani]
MNEQRTDPLPVVPLADSTEGPNTRDHRQTPAPQENESSELGLDRVGFWLLAAQHFSSTWGDRSAEFAFSIYLVEIFVDTLLPASIYGFVTTAIGILFSGAVGHQIDIRTRLPTIRVCIATQKIFASICYGLFLILFTRFSGLDNDLQRLLLAFISTCGCGLKLATVGMNVCVERDWVMTIASSIRSATSSSRPGSPATERPASPFSTRSTDHADRVLLKLNTTLRRIDLICKLVAPLFVSSLTSTVGYMHSAIVLLSISLGTAVFEIVFVGITYKRFPALAISRPPREETPVKRSVTGIGKAIRDWGEQQVQDWNEFIRHPIFLSSLSISLLYFNVLSFDSPFIAYLKSETTFSDPLIAGMRGLCVVTGLFGTFAMPWMEKRIGLIRTGSWAIWSEALSLVPTVVSLFIGINGRKRPVWNSVLLFAATRHGDISYRALVIRSRAIDSTSKGLGTSPSPEYPFSSSILPSKYIRFGALRVNPRMESAGRVQVRCQCLAGHGVYCRPGICHWICSAAERSLVSFRKVTFAAYTLASEAVK